MSVFQLTNSKIPNEKIISHSSKGVKGVKATIKNMLRQYETFLKTEGKSKKLDFFKIFNKDTTIDDINISPYNEEEKPIDNSPYNEEETHIEDTITKTTTEIKNNFEFIRVHKEEYENKIIEIDNDINKLAQKIKKLDNEKIHLSRKVWCLTEILKYADMMGE
jgi:predicted RNase H-like nuclease (RuvC/YqgF family)